MLEEFPGTQQNKSHRFLRVCARKGGGERPTMSTIFSVEDSSNLDLIAEFLKEKKSLAQLYQIVNAVFN